jgi:hypothetical protein
LLGELLVRTQRVVRIATVVAAALAMAVVTGCTVRGPGRNQQTVYYPGTDEDFANPERGFASSRLPPDPKPITWDPCGSGNNFTAYDYDVWTPALRLQDLLADRADGRSLVYMRYHIAEFRDAPLSDAFLARVDQDFATARTAGFKIAPRFAYNYFTGGPDAPLDRVLQHLDQLAPVFRRNVDVLAYLELGFIGCWGEMHTSSNGLIGPDGLNSATRAILEKAFAVVPAERMIAIRYAGYKFQFFGNSTQQPIAPLDDATAFDGSIRARWGEDDDCVVCGEWNWGTWSSPPDDPYAVRRFLHDDNRYVVQEGEAGQPGPPQPPDADRDGWTSDYDACARVLPIFEQGRWSALNGGYRANTWFGAAADRWRREGCFDTIAVHLGYRFRVESATLPLRVRRGHQLRVELAVDNVGWAAPYNERDVELVLRNRKTHEETRIPVAADPRRWQPGPTTVTLAARVPRTLARGRYDVLVALPDPAPSLHDRAEYAIRFANAGTWDGTCGCNDLHASVRVATITR